MKIFVVNRGSSSIKCELFVWEKCPETYAPAVWRAHLQWKNEREQAVLRIETGSTTHEERVNDVSLAAVLPWLRQSGFGEIDAIGHRIVHGGKEFTRSVRIDQNVIATLRSFAALAPLHNEVELEAIEFLSKECPNTPQIAVFDTAFHHTLPQYARVYPGPYAWYEAGIQRYGFHGISFQYCTRRATELLGKAGKVVLCHLGSGASLCAVREGRSVDTTMGFTPLEGLMMDTRSGSIDPGILLHLQKTQSAEELSEQLYFASGLLGVSGVSSDMRDILRESALGQPRAQLALEVYVHRLISCIGAMISSLQGIDALVFTAGIGENAPLVRERVAAAFSFLGVKIDVQKNREKLPGEVELSAPDAAVRVFVIPTQESFEIAKEVYSFK